MRVALAPSLPFLKWVAYSFVRQMNLPLLWKEIYKLGIKRLGMHHEESKQEQAENNMEVDK